MVQWLFFLHSNCFKKRDGPTPLGFLHRLTTMIQILCEIIGALKYGENYERRKEDEMELIVFVGIWGLRVTLWVCSCRLGLTQRGRQCSILLVFCIRRRFLDTRKFRICP